MKGNVLTSFVRIQNGKEREESEVTDNPQDRLSRIYNADKLSKDHPEDTENSHLAQSISSGRLG